MQRTVDLRIIGNGTEWQLKTTNHTVRGPEGAVRFVLADARNNGFPADFEAEKDLDTAIKGCGFDGSGGLPCKVAAYAHLNWEGARLHVVVTRIESIEPPAAWQ